MTVLLDHQVTPSERHVDEAILGALKLKLEPEYLEVKVTAPLKIRDGELGDDFSVGVHTNLVVALPAITSAQEPTFISRERLTARCVSGAGKAIPRRACLRKSALPHDVLRFPLLARKANFSTG